MKKQLKELKKLQAKKVLTLCEQRKLDELYDKLYK